MKFRVQIDRERCKGCELCLSACPTGALAMSTDFNSRGVHVAVVAAPDKCVGCTQCARMCPDACIEIEPDKD